MQTQDLRFSQKYRYNREQMLHDGGKDFCPVGHQIDYLQFLQKAVESVREENSLFSEELSDENVAILTMAGILHDIGESTHDDIRQEFGSVLGDKLSGTKTPADRELERKIRYYYYEKHFTDVDPDAIKAIEAIVSHDAKNTLLHAVFEAAHIMQTIDTSEQSFRPKRVADLSPEDQLNRDSLLHYLRYEVLKNELGRLGLYKYVPSARETLDRFNDPKNTLIHDVTPENAQYHTQCCAASARVTS